MDKVLGSLGLCLKAGKLTTGEDSVLKAIRGNKAKLVVIADNASANTLKRITNAAKFYNVPYIIHGTKEDMGAALGKNIRAVAAVLDEGFGASILKTAEKNCTE